MSGFGEFLKERRERRDMTQVSLSGLLRQKGIYIHNSVISRWESGERVPRDTNRTDIIIIGEILNLTAEEKDKILMLANLAPIHVEQVKDEEYGKKSEISEAITENAQVTVEPTWRASSSRLQPYKGAEYLDIPLDNNEVMIEKIVVLTSDPTAAFEFLIFDQKQPPDIPRRENIYLRQGGSGRRRTYIRIKPELYYDEDECSHLHCGFIVEGRPIHFDMNEEELDNYYKKPVTFTVTIEYRIT